MARDDDSAGAPDRSDHIIFHYIKSPHFRVIHVDGAFGGPTPRGGLHLAVWNERTPIPQQMEYELAPDGNLGAEFHEGRVAKAGIVREVEAELLLDVPAAKALRDLIDEKIKFIETWKASKKQSETPK